jgi:hypothetical protein
MPSQLPKTTCNVSVDRMLLSVTHYTQAHSELCSYHPILEYETKKVCTAAERKHFIN